MNILFLTKGTANRVTGGESCVPYYYYHYFKEKGYNVLMLAGQKTIDTNNKDFIHFPDEKNLYSPQNTLFLDTVISQFQPQIVFNHTGLSPCWSYILKCIKKKNNKIKIVTVYHNSPFGIYGIKKYHKLSELKDSMLKRSIDYIIKSLYKIKYYKLLNMQARYSDKIVMLSEKFIPEYLFFTQKKYALKMTSIPNPLTIEELPREKKENIILFVGRLSQEKGLPYLLKIWEILEKRHPEWKLQIVGDGNERTKAENLAQHLGLQHCTFYGRQRPEKYYNKAKIFCMTSLFEGFGLVLTEAMHYGVIPFAFNSYANVTDIIDDEVNGFIIPPFEITTYANKISFLIEHESLRLQMSKAAVIKSEEYSLSKIGMKWEQLFNALINKQ